MAARLGEFFLCAPVTVLRCSPLERARETMAPIAARHPGIDVVMDARVIEADSMLQGMTPAQRCAPGTIVKYYREPLRPSWGEPYARIAARMRSAIADAALAAGDGGQAVLVSHQCPIWVARLAAEGRPLAHLPVQRHCTLASVTTFTLDDAGQVCFVGYAEPAADL
jgi:broad specificity phosphatase PhoE